MEEYFACEACGDGNGFKGDYNVEVADCRLCHRINCRGFLDENGVCITEAREETED